MAEESHFGHSNMTGYLCQFFTLISTEDGHRRHDWNVCCNQYLWTQPYRPEDCSFNNIFIICFVNRLTLNYNIYSSCIIWVNCIYPNYLNQFILINHIKALLSSWLPIDTDIPCRYNYSITLNFLNQFTATKSSVSTSEASVM